MGHFAGWRGVVVGGLASLCLLLCVIPGAYSQSTARRPPPIKTTPEYKALFKRMFDDPTNVELTFRFAALATRLGDYEAAIGALERILYFNPRLPRVKLQLGTLYYKLGAYKMARSYFDAARAAGAPPAVRAEAERFVAALERREAPSPSNSPSTWSVFAQAGLRYQSNASQGPGGDIRSFGQSVPINSSFAKQPDWNLFGLFGVNYIRNLQHGNEDAIEASALGYYARQLRLTQFDFGIIEGMVGPRFSLPVQGGSVKVYGIGTAATLGQAPYFQGYGAGVSTRFLFDTRAIAWGEAAVEYRHRDFFDSARYPTSSEQTGGLLTTYVRAQGAVAGRVQWFTRLTFEQGRAAGEFDFNSYDRWAAELGFPITFSLDWGGSAHEVVVTPFGGIAYYSFAQPNPAVDPFTTRKDHELRGGVMLDVQIDKNVGLRAQVQSSETMSTLPNFSMQNHSFTIGPTVRY